MFRIDWTKEWDRLQVTRDRRSADIFLVKSMHPVQSASKFVPIMYVEQETLGL